MSFLLQVIIICVVASFIGIGLVFVMDVISNLRQENKFLREEIDFLHDHNAETRATLLSRVHTTQLKASEVIDELQHEVADAYLSLEMALGATPSPIGKVTSEIGLHGVIYQFLPLEQEEANA